MYIAFSMAMEQLGEGYSSPDYVRALAEFGRPLELPASRGWLLAREIPGYPGEEDACGAYPLFCCRHWNRLADDIAALEDQLISCVLVTDPFGDYTRADLAGAFPDLVQPFKEHLTVELDAPPERTFRAHHRYYARRALRDYRVELCDEPLQYLEQWNQLYSLLTRRHGIRGMAGFSARSFRRQFQVPGVRVFLATRGEVIDGMHVWFGRGDVAYHHLAAYSDAGYRASVSYALMWSAIRWFADAGVRQLDLGAGAGFGQQEDGLTRFKRGWSNASRTVYLCGRVLQTRRYAQLTNGAGIPQPGFFPGYRAVPDKVAV